MDINVYHPLTKDPYFGFAIIFVICILAVAWFIKVTVLESLFCKDENEEEIQKENENKDENEKQNEDKNKFNGLKYGAIVSTIKDSEDNSYKVVFDPDNGLLIPMVFYYIDSYYHGIPSVYYMKIPMGVLKEIYDNFKNENNEAEKNHEDEKNV